MDIVIKILQLILSLSLLVLVHELGHFLFARLFKCRVDKFYLFFDPWFSLYKFKKGDTEYGIGWIPMGGYCKIAGMMDESMDKEQLAEAPKPWEYRSKPAWQRLFIIIGGVLFNLILAMFIYIGMTFVWGESYVKNEDIKDGLQYSKVAQNLGFKNGDKILSIDGKTIENYRQIPQYIIFGDKRDVLVERGGVQLTIHIADSSLKSMMNEKSFAELRFPFIIGSVHKGMEVEKAGLMAGDSLVAVDSVPMRFYDEYQAAFQAKKSDTVLLSYARGGEVISSQVLLNDKGQIDATVEPKIIYPITVKEYNLFQSVPKGISRGVDQIDNYIKQLKVIANPDTEAYKSVGGVISMGKIFPGEWDWFQFWNITALLSIMLAVLNILPVPGLDGGHLVFILFEMITRRKPSEKFMEIAGYVGFFLIIGLIVVVNGTDIIRLFK